MATGRVYKGIAYPFRKGTSSVPDTAGDDELIKMALTQIVMTAKRQRVMRPGIGSGSHGFVFETNDDLLKKLIQTDLGVALSQGEPRAIVRKIQVERDKIENKGQVLITVFFVVPATQKETSVTVSVPTSSPE